MRTIGNILWFIFATLAFWPFGKEIVYGNGTWKPDSGLYLVHYDSWNSIWKAVFQDGKTFFHAIWCQCEQSATRDSKKATNTVPNGLVISTNLCYHLKQDFYQNAQEGAF